MMTHELHRLITAWLPSTSTVHLTALTIEQESVVLQLTATAPTASCPCCTVPSSSVHSRYGRHVTDLSWGALAVHIHLIMRKFICRNASCARHPRPTPALPASSLIGVALGGNAGARLAARLRLSTSPATLLRLVRTAPVLATPAPQAIGVDEWAWRRGHRYGTILVDLMTHRVVDLLPDRSAASVAAWLAQHPTITVICRDRNDLYADGIRRGAPAAVQVVDRFHLVQNLRQALEALLLGRRPALQAAAVGTAMALTQADGPLPVVSMYRGRRQSPKPAELREETTRPPQHTRWVAIYEAVHTLRAQGMPLATIARRLGISRPTVYAYLRRDTPPGPRRLQRRPSARVLTPYLPYLIRRWRETQADSMQLWREIQALGYTHSARTVCRFITQLRRAADAGRPAESQGSPYTRLQGPSARAVSFAMVSPATKRSHEAQMYVDQLCQLDAAIARAHALSEAFLTLVRERRGADLTAWMAEAISCGIDELASFARGLQDDLSAVTAGLTLAWSNGVTEGHIHRLKLLKRQGYGRAGFALLRQRVLHAA